jgi:hypothetical protein
MSVGKWVLIYLGWGVVIVSSAVIIGILKLRGKTLADYLPPIPHQ